MALRSVYRKIERTPEEQAALKADRERYQRERLSQDEIRGSSDHDGPYRNIDVRALLATLGILKDERNRLGLSLEDVSARCGMDKAALSRLETGKVLNPTLGTIWKYAYALGMKVNLSAESMATTVKA